MEGTEIKLLRVATTRPEPGPDLGFGTRYPTRPEFCLLVPPLPDSVLPLLLEQCKSNGDKTALHLACNWKKLNFVETVIDLVPIENRFKLIIATDDGGNTVLHAAVASGDKRFVLALKMDQLTGEQQYAIMVKENKDRLRALDLAKEQKNKQLKGFLDNLLQESSIRKCNE